MEQPIERTQNQPATPFSFWNLRAWLRDLVLSVCIAVLIIVFLYQPVKVEGTSMMPGLTDQQRIFINKFVYRFGQIQRGDVVVFWYPMDPSKSYIKRTIGLPGEVVRIAGGRVYINEQPLLEPYILPEYLDHRSYPPVRVAPGCYYVLGDHRSSSNDSRTWGTVAREHIYGKAVLAYWPVDKFGVLE